LASRRQSSLKKSGQGSRATSTLKHSSNQNGFRTRNKNRSMVAAAVSIAKAATEFRVQSEDRVLGCEAPAVLFAALIAVFKEDWSLSERLKSK
jgi:hypothetical protein